jgi:hypothetical protein
MPPIRPGFHGQRQQVRDPLLVGDRRHAFGHADAQIDDAVGRQFEGRATGDDLALGQRCRHQAGRGNPELAGIGGVVLGRQGLHVLGRFGDDHAVDQNPRNLDLPRRQPAALGDSLDLGDHDAVAVLGRHGHGQVVEGQCFTLHGDIAEGIGGGAAHEGNIDLPTL